MPTPTQQRVLVTAGASGIGHAIATAFSAAGAGVHVADIDATAVEKLNAAHPAHITTYITEPQAC